MNEFAVRLAVEARENAAEGPVYVVGSISTFSPQHESSREPAEARADYAEQAKALAGANLLGLEMRRGVEQATCAVEAAVATGLPV